MGEKRTLGLAARYAQEWNGTFQTPDNYSRLNARLDELLRKNNRAPSSVRRSLMTGTVFGRDENEVQRLVAARKQSVERLRERGIIVGTAPAVIEQLRRLEEAGCQRVMLQWLELDDLDRLEALAREVLPHFHR